MKTSSRAFSLVEIVIAFALLGVLMLMAMVTTQAMSKPATETTYRADLVRQANAAYLSMSRELSSGFYAGGFLSSVGAYNPAGQNILLFSTPNNAVVFAPVTGFTAPSTVNTGPDVVYAFRQTPGDPDNDGLTGEWRLVRASGGTEVTVLTNIADVGQANVPNGTTVVNPTFSLVAANLTVTFTVMRRVAFNSNSGTQEFAAYTVSRSINLRNLNQ